jgi:DNA primase
MSVIDDIKQRIDIVDLISEQVPLQKSGRNFKAQCPFHTENHASFFVFPERQTWHCFGACGTGGDIFAFIMKKEGIDFGQALRLLSEKAGVTLVLPSPREKTQDAFKEKLLQLNEMVAEFYHHLLLNSPSGEIARTYINSRGLSPQIIEHFQLGYSPDNWDALQTYMLNKGHQLSDLAATGLIQEKSDGGYYDRFRNRLMFPIKDIQGRVIGFGARALDDSQPKYLNSPQSIVFDKGGSLYGIDRAKTAIRQNNIAIIVEGYMDVLTAHQFGWENTVASMGTALGEKQSSIIKNLTKNIIISLDSDVAGEEATKRIAGIIDIDNYIPRESHLRTEVKVATRTQGKDPDEQIREDPDSWVRSLDNATPLIDFIIDSVTNNVNLESTRDKAEAADQLLSLISKIDEPTSQGHYIHKLAITLHINEGELWYSLKKYTDKKDRIRNRRKPGTALEYSFSLSSDPLEEYCLGLLLQYPELKSECIDIRPDCFEQIENREIFTKWLECTDLNTLIETVDVSLHPLIDKLLVKVYPPALISNDEKRRQDLNRCLVRLNEKKLKKLETQRGELRAMEAEDGGTEAELAKLREQGIEPSQQLKEVFARQTRQRQPVIERGEQ